MRKWTVVLTLLALCLFIGVTQAQDEPAYRVDHETAITLVLNTVAGLVIAAFGSAPITLVLVAFLKKIPALGGISGPALSFGTASVLYVAALIASVAGVQVQFEGVLELLTVVGPALLSFIGTLIVAPVGYHIAKALEVPLIGEARSAREYR